MPDPGDIYRRLKVLAVIFQDWRVLPAYHRPVATRRKTLVEDPEDAVLSPYWNVRAQLAHAPSTEPAFLELLASDPTPAVRQAVACNPSSNASILERLAREADEIGKHAATVLRRRVGLHPNTSLEVLMMLAERGETSVMMAVGRNPNLTEDIAAVIVRSGDRHGIFCVATNPSLSDSAKRELGVEALPSIALGLGVAQAIQKFECWASTTPPNLVLRQLVKRGGAQAS